MRRIVYIFLLMQIIVYSSCQRDRLTYDYDPRCEVAFDLDWSSLSEAPTGISIYCYPVNGGSPIVYQSDSTANAIVKLAQGKYNILVFNQVPSDFGTISFDGLSRYETACVKAVATKSGWYASKSDNDVPVRNPEELAVATYENYEITENDIRKVLGLDNSEDGDDVDEDTKNEPEKVLQLKTKRINKSTRVRVRVSQIQFIYSTRASIYGMASGYNFSTQTSSPDMVTHLLENWTTTFYDEDDGYVVEHESENRDGEIEAVFSSFGLPNQTIKTRSNNDSWAGSMSLEMLLADKRTVYSQKLDLSDKVSDSGIAGQSLDLYIDIGYSNEDQDKPLPMPIVVPEGDDESGFNVNVNDWGDVEHVVIPMK